MEIRDPGKQILHFVVCQLTYTGEAMKCDRKNMVAELNDFL